MSTIRGVKDRRFNFVQLLNSMLEDPSLSLKAKGFIGYCLTKPSDWRFHVTHLCNVLKEGEKAIYAVINECVEQGYAFRYQPRGKDGEFLPIETVISDSKHEIAETKKEIEAQPDFNKCLPLPPFGDADSGHAENGSHSNTVASSNTKKKQQQQASPATAAVSFKSSEKEQQQSTKPDVYPCLNHIDIPLSDKAEITRNYPLPKVMHALHWIEKNDKPLTKGLAPALKWACKTQPEIPVPKTDIELVNKTYALRYDGMRSGACKIDALNKAVEIETGCAYTSVHLAYDAKGFMDQFTSALRKNNFRILEAT